MQGPLLSEDKNHLEFFLENKELKSTSQYLNQVY